MQRQWCKESARLFPREQKRTIVATNARGQVQQIARQRMSPIITLVKQVNEKVGRHICQNTGELREHGNRDCVFYLSPGHGFPRGALRPEFAREFRFVLYILADIFVTFD